MASNKQPTQSSPTTQYQVASGQFTVQGAQDFHCHIDRAYTFHPRYFQHEGGLDAFIDAPLTRKQVVTGILHRGPAYQKESLSARMQSVVEAKIAAGESLVNMITDCAPQLNGVAFETGQEIKKKFEKDISLNVGAYPIFGFKHYNSDRHKHLLDLAKRADFLVALPERDDKPDHSVGFDGHLRIMLDLACEHTIPLQIHTDQVNASFEDGTKKVVQAVKWIIGSSSIPESKRPKIWVVHKVSPASYDEKRFWRLLEGMRKYNIGLICCPHAAASMRQLRNHSAPIHNSIARVRECLYAGIDVRLGTDNIKDLFMPMPHSPLLSREYDALASLLRFYDTNVISKLARGERLNETDRDVVERSLARDYEAWGMTLPQSFA